MKLLQTMRQRYKKAEVSGQQKSTAFSSKDYSPVSFPKTKERSTISELTPSLHSGSGGDKSVWSDPCVLEVDENTPLVNEKSNSNIPTTETDCFSDDVNCELELEDMVELFGIVDTVSDDSKMPTGSFLQPKPDPVPISQASSDEDTISFLNIYIDCEDVDNRVGVERPGIPFCPAINKIHPDPEDDNIEIPYEDFVPLIGQIERENDSGVTDKITTSMALLGLNEDNKSEYSKVVATIEIISLTGVTRIESRKKLGHQARITNHCGSSDIVRAVVIYRGNDDEKDTATRSSLPLIFGDASETKQTRLSKGSAQWRGMKEKMGDDSCCSPRVLTVSRTLTRPLNSTSGGEEAMNKSKDYIRSKCKARGIDKGRHANRQPPSPSTDSKISTLDIVLQVGLMMQGQNEFISLGESVVSCAGECETMELHIPVMEYPISMSPKKNRGTFFTPREPHYVSFLNDTDTRYRLDKNARLNIKLTVEPVKSDQSLTDSRNDENKWDLQSKDSNPNRKIQDKGTHSEKQACLRKCDSSRDGKDRLDEGPIVVVDKEYHSTPTSRIDPNYDSIEYQTRTHLSTMTKASKDPLFELIVSHPQQEHDGELSDISDSDSSGGSFIHSLYSASSLKQATKPEVNVKCIQFLTCDLSPLFRCENELKHFGCRMKEGVGVDGTAKGCEISCASFSSKSSSSRDTFTAPAVVEGDVVFLLPE